MKKLKIILIWVVLVNVYFLSGLHAHTVTVGRDTTFTSGTYCGPWIGVALECDGNHNGGVYYDVSCHDNTATCSVWADESCGHITWGTVGAGEFMNEIGLHASTDSYTEEELIDFDVKVIVEWVKEPIIGDLDPVWEGSLGFRVAGNEQTADCTATSNIVNMEPYQYQDDNWLTTGYFLEYPESTESLRDTLNCRCILTNSTEFEFRVGQYFDLVFGLIEGPTVPISSVNSLTIEEVQFIFSKEPKLIDPFDVDRQPVLFDNANITLNGNLIANADEELYRDGVSADGAARLIILSDASNAGERYDLQITSEEHPNLDNGQLELLYGEGEGTSINTFAVNTDQGPKVLAIYRAPKTFGASIDSTTREVKLEITHENSGKTLSKSIIIRRPPVLLVHGFWSDPGVWDQFTASSDVYDFYPVDYSGTNAANISMNGTRVPSNIYEAIFSYKSSHNLAAIKCDVVGHSMGGILTRWYMTEELNTYYGYRNLKNYFEGDIRKLISIGTPHSGSPWGNIMYDNRNFPIPYYIPILQRWGAIPLKEVFSILNHPIDDGAVYDLAIPNGIYSQNGTSILNQFPEVDTKVHSIYTNYSLRYLCDILELVYDILDFSGISNHSEIFQGGPSDLIVPVISQKGGLSSPQTSTISGDECHVGQTGNSNVISEVLDLLEISLDSVVFADHFIPTPLRSDETNMYYSGHETDGQKNREIYTEPSSYVQITSPSNGAVFNSGEMFEVTVQASNVDSMQSVLFIYADGSYTDIEPPFTTTILLPENYLGNYGIGALGKDLEGNLSFDFIDVTVVTSAEVQSIDVFPQILILDIPDLSFSLTVKGTFSDGITRDIASSITGTSYAVANPNIATVSENGQVTAISNGETTITISNGTAQKSVDVRVVIDQNYVPPSIPRITFEPNALDFGFVELDSSVIYPLTLTNAGEATLEVEAITQNNSVFMVKSTMPISIEPGLSSTIEIEFTPILNRPYFDDIIFYSNDPINGSVFLPVSGVGFLMGDFTLDGIITFEDVDYMLNFILTNESATPQLLLRGDFDANDRIDINDLIQLIDRIVH